MILNDYKLVEDLAVPLEQYQRDTNSSPILLVENLLRKFLYDEGYIMIGDDDEVIRTPNDIYLERKNKFIYYRNGRNCWKLEYGDLDFGCFSYEEIDEVIEKLLDFSDEELEELDANKWNYPQLKYKPFIRAKLENPLLTPEEFLNKDRVRVQEYKSRNSIHLKHYKHGLIVQFNLKYYSRELVVETYDVLCEMTDDEIGELISARKSANSQKSAEFVLEYLGKYKPKQFKKKYCVFKDNGNVSIVKGGHNFGTHSPDKFNDVWDFLNAHNWDSKFSTKSVGLKGLEYNGWLYLQMENIGDD